MPAQEEEDADMLDFQKWKKKWEKNYATPDEDKARFETFKENLRTERFYYHPPPSGQSLWEVLDEKADRPFKEHFGYIRLDRNFATSDESDGDNDESHGDAATVKPVKRTSDDTKQEDPVKRQKTGSVVAKTQGCCSVENEES